MIAIRHSGESQTGSVDVAADENLGDCISLPLNISQRGIEILNILNEVFDGLETEETVPELEATHP